jgi:hypothetical protein
VSEREEEPLSPAEEAEVSRLLAEAGGPVPMPAAVEARLQVVLDELAAERAGEPEAERPTEGASVVALRTRRRWPRVLLAAAAVLVGGYGVGTAVQGSLSGSDEMTSADSSSAGSSGSTDSDLLESTPGDGALEEQGADAGRDQDGAPKASSSYSRAAGTVRIRSERLDVGVRRALRVLAGTQTLAELDSRTNLGDPGCRPTEAAADNTGEVLPVRYDRRPAVLVTRPLEGRLVEVTVYSCAGVELDSTVVAHAGS